MSEQQSRWRRIQHGVYRLEGSEYSIATNPGVVGGSWEIRKDNKSVTQYDIIEYCPTIRQAKRYVEKRASQEADV